VISVKNDRNAVSWCNSSNEESTSDAASNGGFLLAVGNTLVHQFSNSTPGKCMCVCMYLSCEVRSSTLGHLQDDGSFSIASGLERSDNGRRGGDVLWQVVSSRTEISRGSVVTYDSWNCEVVFLGIVEKLENLDDAISTGHKKRSSNRALTSSPTMTPDFRLRTSVTPMIALYTRGWMDGRMECG
jgi:hypothetical protein